MLMKLLLFICLTVASTLIYNPLCGQIHIEWDQSTVKRVTNGVYARVKRINTGELVLVYSEGRSTRLRRSSDNGKTWSNDLIITQKDWYSYTNSEMIQLANGWLLYTWNGRPLEQDAGLPYTINTIISKDNGFTWSDERTVYTAGTVTRRGAWEPVLLQIPSGEIQLYFANEYLFPNTNEQDITLLRSFDNGLSWGHIRRVSYRTGSRDGMPVPVYLQNEKGIAFAIEDNGIHGKFKPVIIWSSVSDNWTQGYADGNSSRRWHALSEDSRLASEVYAGAPYLIQLPTGETLLSIQSTEGRIRHDMNVSIMQVYIGNDEAREFKNKSTPFQNWPDEMSMLWNSLAVIDDETILAVGSSSGIWTVEGKIVRETSSAIPPGRSFEGISLYPNPLPGNHSLRIDFSSHTTEAYELSIFNIFGQEVGTKTIPAQSTIIDMGVNFSRGVYLVSLRNSAGTIHSERLLVN
jgi:hypothetical protein